MTIPPEWSGTSSFRNSIPIIKVLSPINCGVPRPRNAKANSNELAVLNAKVNNLTAQIGAQALGGAGCTCWTFGGYHVQSDCPRENSGLTYSWKWTPPGSGENGTKMVEVVF